MRLFPVTTIVLLLLSTAAGAAPPAVEIELPALFGNHMVLQRDIELPVWGTARPGGEVLIRIAGQRKTALVDEDGSWHARLDPLEAGGPYELIVEGEGRLRFSDVLVGEVWLASGQSNMAMPLAGWGRILDFEQEIARADYPEIRLFQVERDTAVRPRSDVPGGRWRPCSSESVAEFSSTAYFFGRRLHRELGVPVGLIHSSWGGTVAEAWTGGETLTEMDDFRDAVQALREASDEEIADMRRVFEEAMAVRQTAWAEDAGLVEGEPIWADPSLEDSAWASMELPTMWEDAGLDGLDGVVWYRREVELPEGWAGSELRLSLGTIDDADETYFNGVRIGAMDIWNEPRSYTVPAGIARAGRNVIAVRVLDNWLSGGISGEPHDLGLEGPTGPMLGLAGSWRYRISVDSRELDPLPPWPDDPNQPTVLYNAMLRPLAPYAIRGAIWYQGESNVVRAHQYRTLFPALIRDWRTTWGQGNFPFYFVQLANFLPTEPEPGGGDRHRQRLGHPPQEQAGGRQPSRPPGSQPRLSAPGRRLRSPLPGDASRGHAGAPLLRPRRRRTRGQGRGAQGIRHRRSGPAVPLGRGDDRRKRRGGLEPRRPRAGRGSLRLGRQSGLQSLRCVGSSRLSLPHR
jgi:sialate O-acetylesterase